MRFIIHRGTKEIGGSCVEIWTDSTRIVVDFGMPLVNPDRTQFDSRAIKNLSVKELIGKGVLPDIKGLYDEKPENTTLILSHAHQDHFGLIKYVNEKCKIYLGKATQKLIEITNTFTNQNWVLSNYQHFESGKTFVIGDIEVTPYLMDHSAFDAYAFLIKADGKSLFYSGDFRIHGRKAKAFDWFSFNSEKKVDYLLLEGTAGRDDNKFKTEAEIETEFIKVFNENKGINLIYTSGQNIDRLVSIYKACKRTGKTLAVDFYIANVLKELSEFGAIPYPSKSFPEIKVFFPFRLSKMISNQGNETLLYRFKDFKITKEQINERFDKIVMIVRPSMLKDLKHIAKLENGLFIYSMWGGYKKDKATKEFIDFLLGKGMTEKHIHTSGHADQSALKRMVDVLQPKNLVPIHTFEGDEYRRIFSGVHVLQINDNQVVTDDKNT